MASPAYGERWGRHWLDLARYTDSFDSRILTTGQEMDCQDAWRYRDWVIDAFNRDLPYNQFVRDQIAGDLIPSKGGFNRQGIIATGFLAIGNWGGGDADKDKLLTDIADDQVDVTSRTFLGLTVACTAATTTSSIPSRRPIITPWRASSSARTSCPTSAPDQRAADAAHPADAAGGVGRRAERRSTSRTSKWG